VAYLKSVDAAAFEGAEDRACNIANNLVAAMNGLPCSGPGHCHEFIRDGFCGGQDVVCHKLHSTKVIIYYLLSDISKFLTIKTKELTYSQ